VKQRCYRFRAAQRRCLPPPPSFAARLLLLAVTAVVSSGCGGAPGTAGEVKASAGLLGPLVAQVTKGAPPACYIADRRTGRPPSLRTRNCTFPAIPGLQLWLPPEDMAQPLLHYRTSPVPDSAAVVAVRDSLLRTLQPEGRPLRLRDCTRVPPRRHILSTTRTEVLGADVSFLIIREGDGRYSLRMQAWPAGARNEPCERPAT
jgi:hypothetical protein